MAAHEALGSQWEHSKKGDEMWFDNWPDDEFSDYGPLVKSTHKNAAVITSREPTVLEEVGIFSDGDEGLFKVSGTGKNYDHPDDPDDRSYRSEWHSSYFRNEKRAALAHHALMNRISRTGSPVLPSVRTPMDDVHVSSTKMSGPMFRALGIDDNSTHHSVAMTGTRVSRKNTAKPIHDIRTSVVDAVEYPKRSQ